MLSLMRFSASASRNGQGAKHDIQVFGGDGIGQLFLVLFAAQMGQQVSGW